MIIDLGELPRQEDATHRQAGEVRRVARAVLAVVTAGLVAVTGGAAHVRPPDPPTVVPARLGDLLFADSDRFFLVGAGQPPAGNVASNRVISAYALPSGRLESRTTV